MLNNQFVIRQAGHFAQRLQSECGDDRSKQVVRAFELAFGRKPDGDEARASDELIISDGLQEFCRQILNTSEFIYVD